MATAVDELAPDVIEQRLFGDYARFYVACGILVAVGAVVVGLLAPTPGIEPGPVFLLALLTAAFTFAWHRWVTGAMPSQTHLVIESAVYLGLVMALAYYGGGKDSPLIFLSLPPVILAGITLATRPALLLGLWAVAGLLGAALLSSRGPMQATPFWWAALASPLVVAALAGLLGQALKTSYRSLEEARARADRFSNIDGLTGLYNRRHLDNLLPQEVARASRHGRPLGLLMADSDHLKEVNDTYGHHAGDLLIIEMALVISEQIRLVDTAIRYGGDEFIVIMPDTDLAGALIAAERICTNIAERPIHAQGKDVPTTASLGIASFPESGEDYEALLAGVDKALYASKRGGRNRVTAYSPELEVESKPTAVEPNPTPVEP